MRRKGLPGVAFRKEGVDADHNAMLHGRISLVAFRKEGVDADTITDADSGVNPGRLPQGRCGC